VGLPPALEDVLTAPERLRAQRVEPLSFFGHATDEPSVLAWMPAAAVYFRDPDGHQLEYLAMLDAKPRPELGIVPQERVGRELARQLIDRPGRSGGRSPQARGC
jgi:lactoylglutathione lyase